MFKASGVTEKSDVAQSRQWRFSVIIICITVAVFAVLLILSTYVTHCATQKAYMSSTASRTSDAIDRLNLTIEGYANQAEFLSSGTRMSALLSSDNLSGDERVSLENDIAQNIYSSIEKLSDCSGFALQDTDGNFYLHNTVLDEYADEAERCVCVSPEDFADSNVSVTIFAISDCDIIAVTVPVKSGTGTIVGYATLFLDPSVYALPIESSADERYLFESTSMQLIATNKGVPDDISQDTINSIAQSVSSALENGKSAYKYVTPEGNKMLAAVCASQKYPIVLMSCRSMSNMTRMIATYATMQGAISLLIAAVLAIIVISVYKLLTQPVSKMIDQCSRLANGYDAEPFDVHGDNELRKLASAFNLYRERLENAAYTDNLLGIGTRAKYLANVSRRIKSFSSLFTCCLIDLKNFGQYNDMFSLEIGDALLVATAERLKNIFGEQLYRIDGDVFMGILAGRKPDEALFERIRSTVHRTVQIGQLDIVLDCRAAACMYPDNGLSAVELLENANIALAHAKENNLPYVIYSSKITAELRLSDEIMTLLRTSILEHKLEVWYQPIYDVSTGEFVSAEALMRLFGNDGKLLPTAKVIEIAERSGMIDSVGEYVLDETVRMIYRMRDAGHKISYVHVNLSAQQIVQSTCAARTLDIIKNAGGKPSDVSIELTETSVLSSFDAAINSVKQLRRAGAHISLDDFGAGYSGIGYLSTLDLDILKLDTSLMRDITTSEKQREYVSYIIRIARLKDMRVVAEGIETSSELEAVTACGTDSIQGYYFSKPLCEKEFERFIKEYNKH